MEWSKYVLSVMVGGCLLVLYGKKSTGRNKWLFGAGTGTSLMAMELAVEYMLNKAAWEMALSIMKGGAIFSVIVLLGYVREWFGSGRNLPEEKELRVVPLSKITRFDIPEGSILREFYKV